MPLEPAELARCFRSFGDDDRRCEKLLGHSSECGPRVTKPIVILPTENFTVEVGWPGGFKTLYNPYQLEGVITRHDSETCDCSRSWFRPGGRCYCRCHPPEGVDVTWLGCGTESEKTEEHEARET